MSGAFVENLKHLTIEAMEDVRRSLEGLPKIERLQPKQTIMYKWRCLEDYTRYGQDIFGKKEFKKGEIIESCHNTPEGLAWVVDPNKFERIND